MNTLIKRGIAIAGIAAVAGMQSAMAGVAAGENDFRLYWKEGIRMDTENGDFKLKLGGRIQWDNAFYDVDDELVNAYMDPFDDGSEFRRARLEIGGTIYGDYEFKAQYDFAGGDADVKDMFIGMKAAGGKFRAGHFKEPFSLDELTSSKDIQLMERALPNAFSPGRNSGLAYYRTLAEERMTIVAGIFRDANDYGDSKGAEDEVAITTRVTGLPWANEEMDRFVHVGAAVSLREGDDMTSSLRYRARPESHITDIRLADTTSMAGWDDSTLFGLEAALVCGQFAFQTEYIMAQNSFAGMADADVDGFYFQGSYFLTDDHRRYKTSDGIFDKVKPSANFKPGGEGKGAVELVARFSSLNLNDGSMAGGELDSTTIGINWYLNPNMRVGLNYVMTSIDNFANGNDPSIDGEISTIQSRFQVTW